MPRYFFHVRDGTTVLDHDGTVLPDLAAAREIAQRFASELLRDLKELSDARIGGSRSPTNMALSSLRCCSRRSMPPRCVEAARTVRQG